MSWFGNDTNLHSVWDATARSAPDPAVATALVRVLSGCATADPESGVGDPTVDLIVAWNLLRAEARDLFREALDVDDVTWLRGRAWALSISLIQLPYYQHTNPRLAENSRHVIREVLTDAAG